MTTPAVTDQQLIDYSGEHLLHELSMLWELAALLPSRKASTETSAFVESFGIHLRNLIDFFYQKGKGNDVTAWDFFDTPSAWTAKKPLALTNAHTRANKELSHLTQARISGSPPEKAWDTVGLVKEIDTVAREFAVKASAKKLHPDVRKFLQLPVDAKLIWIGDNITHSNIAFDVVGPVSTVSISSQSTHTEIIRKFPLIEPPE
jgi:hypothetical protein